MEPGGLAGVETARSVMLPTRTCGGAMLKHLKIVKFLKVEI